MIRPLWSGGIDLMQRMEASNRKTLVMMNVFIECGNFTCKAVRGFPEQRSCKIGKYSFLRYSDNGTDLCYACKISLVLYNTAHRYGFVPWWSDYIALSHARVFRDSATCSRAVIPECLRIVFCFLYKRQPCAVYQWRLAISFQRLALERLHLFYFLKAESHELLPTTNIYLWLIHLIDQSRTLT